MTWHRADGAPVAPLPLPPRLALVRAARAVTVGGGIGGVLLLIVTIIGGAVNEEVLDARGLDVLWRALITSLMLLAPVIALAVPLRLAAERSLLLRVALLDATIVRPAAPAAERRTLTRGPQPVLLQMGAWSAALGAVAVGVMGGFFVPDDAYSPIARVLALAIPLLAVVGGLAVAIPNRRRGAARRRWDRSWSRASLRWRVSISPVERAERPWRRLRLALTIAPLAVGLAAFLAGTWMRQPGRDADPRTWDSVGEAVIDVLVLTGGVVLAAGSVAILVGAGVWLIMRSRRDASAIRAIARGEAPPPWHTDAIVMDAGPIERAATALGAVGWMLLALAGVPTAVRMLEPQAVHGRFDSLAWLAVPGLALLALALATGLRGARRTHARRSLVLAAITRDPVPWTSPYRDYDRPYAWEWPFWAGATGIHESR